MHRLADAAGRIDRFDRSRPEEDPWQGRAFSPEITPPL